MNYQMTQQLELKNTVKMQSYDFDILENQFRDRRRTNVRLTKSHSEKLIQNSEDSQNEESMKTMMSEIKKRLNSGNESLSHINTKLNEFRRCIEVYDLVDHYQ